MASGGSQTVKDVSTLKAENQRLHAENSQLKKKLQAKPAHMLQRKGFWKKFGIIASVIIASIILTVGNLLFWTGNTLINSNRYVSTVSPLIKQPAIQKGVAQYTTQQLYQTVNVQQIIQDVLPPRADFLAPTLTSQIKGATQSSLQKLLGNQKFQDTWNNTMAKTHARVITYIKNYQGNGTISLSDVYKNLAGNLKNTKLSFLANKQLPASIGSITVVHASWLPTAHNIVTNISLYEWLAILLLLAACSLSIWLAIDRRKMIQTLGIVFSILMILSLISIRLAVLAATNHVSPDYRQAASEAGNIITHPLIIQTRTLLSLAILTAFIPWISGQSKAAGAMRRRVQDVASGQLHKAIFSRGENPFTDWVKRHKNNLRWVAIGAIALVMVFVQLSPKLVFVYGLLMLVLVLVIETCAAPK